MMCDTARSNAGADVRIQQSSVTAHSRDLQQDKQCQSFHYFVCVGLGKAFFIKIF